MFSNEVFLYEKSPLAGYPDRPIDKVLIQAFSTNHNDKDVYKRQAPLCAGLQGFILVNAAEIMRYTYMETHYPNGWSEQDTECVEAMFRKVFQPVLSKFSQTPPYTNGNWGAAVAKAQLSFGVFSVSYTHLDVYKRQQWYRKW